MWSRKSMKDSLAITLIMIENTIICSKNFAMKMGITNSIAFLICQIATVKWFCNPLFSLEDIAEEMKDIEEEMEAQNPIDSMLLDFDPSVCWLLILITITLFLSYILSSRNYAQSSFPGIAENASDDVKLQYIFDLITELMEDPNAYTQRAHFNDVKSLLFILFLSVSIHYNQ